MKNYILLLLAIVILLGCKEDEEIIETDEFTVVVGNHLYTLIQGDDQLGAKGQILPEEILIKVTDLGGDVVNRNLKFEPSSLDSRAEAISFNSETGHETIQWRLGCDGASQSLQILDRFCSSNSNECEDVVIFEIAASARDFQEGWNRSCQQFEGVQSDSRIYIGNDQVFVAARNILYQTTDVSSGSWEFHEPEESLPGNTQMFSKADNAVFREKYGHFFITGHNGSGWYDYSYTIYNAYEIDSRVVSTHTASDYLIEYGSDVVLKKPSTFNYYWDEFISISEVTDNASSQPQAIAVDGDQVFIATTTSSLIQIEDGVSSVLSFPEYSWASYSGDFENFQLEISDQIAFHIFQNNILTVLDLSTSTVIDQVESEYLRIAGNMDAVYILDGGDGDYWTFEEGQLTKKKFDIPEEAGNYIVDVNFFQSEPIFLTLDGYFFYRK